MFSITSIIYMILFYLAYQGGFHKNAKIRFISIAFIMLVGLSSLLSFVQVIFVMHQYTGYNDQLMIRLIFSTISLVVVNFSLKSIFGKESLVDIAKYLWFRFKRIFGKY